MLGVQEDTLARAVPRAQTLTKNDPNENRIGCFLVRLDRRSPAVEKSTIEGILDSESNEMILISKLSSSSGEMTGKVGKDPCKLGNESDSCKLGNESCPSGLAKLGSCRACPVLRVASVGWLPEVAGALGGVLEGRIPVSPVLLEAVLLEAA